MCIKPIRKKFNKFCNVVPAVLSKFNNVKKLSKFCSVAVGAGGANEESPQAVDERSVVASLTFILTS